MGRDVCKFLNELKPTMVMVLVQIIYAGLNILYKLAAIDGMNLRILVAYRYILATIFLAPIAFFVERNRRPKLTWMVTFQAFFCGLVGRAGHAKCYAQVLAMHGHVMEVSRWTRMQWELGSESSSIMNVFLCLSYVPEIWAICYTWRRGVLSQNLYLSSLSLTSTSFAAAMSNLLPAITYIMAMTFRLETMGIRTVAGKVKLLGTATGIGGALVLTFYKGAEIKIWSTNVDLTRGLGSRASISTSHMEFHNRIVGSLLSLGGCFCYALWLIIQAKMNQRYPCYLSSTVLTCMLASIQSVILALCGEWKWVEWKLGWNIRLWTVAYSGILASGLMFTLIAWGIREKGPLFVSLFSPLTLVLLAIMGSLLLDEKLHVGSIVGAAFIVVGLYVVLWGKKKEMKRMSQHMRSKSTEEVQPIEMVFNTTSPYSSPATRDTSTNNNPNIDLSNNSPENLATLAPVVVMKKKKDEKEDCGSGIAQSSQP